MSADQALSLQRFVIPLQMFLRGYYRAPLNIVLLLVIPVLLIFAFGNALGRLSDVLSESGYVAQTLTTEMGQSLGALWAAAFLAGITGFYMIVGAKLADRRLVLSGFHTTTVILLRFTTLALLSAIATVVSFGVLLTQLRPTNFEQTVLVIYLSTLIYGAVGILIGSVIPGFLEGSFAILFFFVMDAFIGSPLFGTSSSLFAFLPLHYSNKVLQALTAEQSHAAVHWLYILIYLIVVSAIALLAFRHSAGVSGGARS